MENRTKYFPIKGGTCYLHPDRVEIISNHFVGRLFSRKGLNRVAVLYFLSLIAMTAAILLSLWIENYFLVAFFAVCWMVSLFSIWQSRTRSLAAVIPRKAIEQIAYKEAVEGVSRGQFIIHFRSGKQLLTRKILLPSALNNGKAVAQSAYYMFKEEGMLA